MCLIIETAHFIKKGRCIMGKAVSRGQALQVSARVATQVNWDELDGDQLQSEVINLTPEEFGYRFTTFLKNGCRVGGSKVIKIDRSKPFDPVSFIGEGWSIEEQDERSLVITELDLTKIQFKTMLRDDENIVKGEEKLRRLKKAAYVRLDARIFQTLWENQYLIPEKWKEKTKGNTTFICFDGTILRSPDGNRCVLYLYWYDGRWLWHYSWLGLGWRVSDPSVLLASS